MYIPTCPQIIDINFKKYNIINNVLVKNYIHKHYMQKYIYHYSFFNKNIYAIICREINTSLHIYVKLEMNQTLINKLLLPRCYTNII